MNSQYQPTSTNISLKRQHKSPILVPKFVTIPTLKQSAAAPDESTTAPAVRKRKEIPLCVAQSSAYSPLKAVVLPSPNHRTALHCRSNSRKSPIGKPALKVTSPPPSSLNNKHSSSKKHPQQTKQIIM